MAADRKYRGMSFASRRAVALIAVVSLLNSMASMIIVPVLPMLVKEFTGDTEHAAAYVGEFAAIFAIAQFLAAPVLGALSDAFGRRRVILISAFGLAADYLLMGFAPSVGWLLIGRVIAGVTSASALAVNAYIADSIAPEERAGAYGWIGAAFAIGFLAGPAIRGLLGNIDPRLPFWVSAGLCFAMALYGTVLLPESLPVERRVRFTLARANIWSSFRLLADNPRAQPAARPHDDDDGRHLPARHARSLYGLSLRLVLGHGRHLSHLCRHRASARAVATRAPFRRSFRRAGSSGDRLCQRGARLPDFRQRPARRAVPRRTPFYALAGLVTPAIQSRLTQSVAHDEQGRLQGTVAGAQALAGLLAPIMFTQIFAFAIGPGHGSAPAGLHLYAAAAVLICGAMLAWRRM
ncbi:MAG TPA: MFS transporter [Sphingobium sp.]|nr:MFS transporter [Sphingobium sp.]